MTGGGEWEPDGAQRNKTSRGTARRAPTQSNGDSPTGPVSYERKGLTHSFVASSVPISRVTVRRVKRPNPSCLSQPSVSFQLEHRPVAVNLYIITEKTEALAGLVRLSSRKNSTTKTFPPGRSASRTRLSRVRFSFSLKSWITFDTSTAS